MRYCHEYSRPGSTTGSAFSVLYIIPVAIVVGLLVAVICVAVIGVTIYVQSQRRKGQKTMERSLQSKKNLELSIIPSKE